MTMEARRTEMIPEEKGGTGKMGAGKGWSGWSGESGHPGESGQLRKSGRLKWGRRPRWLLLPVFCLTAVCLLSSVRLLADESRRACRVERDVTFQNVTMEEIKALEEREKDGMTGLEAVAAWRSLDTGNVSDPESGKSENAGVIYVYGPMSLAFPSRILSGSLEQSMGKRDCVLTSDLSWSLFGSVSTEGCTVVFGDKRYRVAAVIDRKGDVLFLPAEKGAVQKAAFSFKSRERVAEKMEAIGFPEEKSLGDGF